MRLNLNVMSLIALVIFSSTAKALPSDNMEKVYITADSTTYHYKTGIKIFEGHVKVDQGTTHLTAERVVTRDNPKHQIEEMIAYGFDELAHYWTLAKLEEPEMHAKAKIIKFYPILANVTLEQDVEVIQGENSFKGQLIHYNMDDQTITVPASKNARAELVYTPEK